MEEQGEEEWEEEQVVDLEAKVVEVERRSRRGSSSSKGLASGTLLSL